MSSESDDDAQPMETTQSQGSGPTSSSAAHSASSTTTVTPSNNSSSSSSSSTSSNAASINGGGGGSQLGSPSSNGGGNDLDDLLGFGEGTLEERRKAAADHVAALEAEFAALRERLYTEKLASLQREMDLILNGTHNDFAEESEKLERVRLAAIESSGAWRDFQMINIRHIYESEVKLANTETETARRRLRERLLGQVVSKQRKIEDLRLAPLTVSDAVEIRGAKNTRKLRRRGIVERSPSPPPIVQRLPQDPPRITYALREHEVQEDLYLIRRPNTVRRK